MIHLIKKSIEKIQQRFCEHDYVIISILSFIDALISIIPLEFLISGYTIIYKKIKLFKIILLASFFSVAGSMPIYLLGFFGFDYVSNLLNFFNINVDQTTLYNIGNSFDFFAFIFLFFLLPFTPGVLGLFVTGLLKANIFFTILVIFFAKFFRYGFFILFTHIFSSSIFKRVGNIYIRIFLIFLFLAILYYGISQLQITKSL